jgi:bifunctional DNA-binding transcriptional regulator/antitoxin component of YhaV-PrlF toxin-antitoxin module
MRDTLGLGAGDKVVMSVEDDILYMRKSGLGMVRYIDDKGRIVIHYQLRRSMHIKPDSTLVLVPVTGGLAIRVSSDTCMCCGKLVKHLYHYNMLSICDDCLEALKAIR